MPLAKEMYGPFAGSPGPPAGAKVIVVSRFPRPDTPSVRTLAQALALVSVQSASVIEFRDQGPHFLTSLPTLQQPNLWIRGGDGMRPLLAWDGVGASDLLTSNKGQLVLENLDFAVQVAAAAPTKTLCLFQMRGGDFQARYCTFSIIHGESYIVWKVTLK